MDTQDAPELDGISGVVTTIHDLRGCAERRGQVATVPGPRKEMA